MATPARQYQQQMVHFLRKTVTYADNGIARTVGTIPAGSQIINVISGTFVTTAFNAGTTNTINIGTTANDDLYGTVEALGTKAFVVIDEAATATDVNTWIAANNTTITATVVLSGTAATAGSAEVIICYIPDIDG